MRLIVLGALKTFVIIVLVKRERASVSSVIRVGDFMDKLFKVHKRREI